jgi:heme exporter protein A
MSDLALPSPVSPPVVLTEGLKRRQGTRWALRGVDIAVAAGRALMICGANGSGKTTLLRLVGTAIRPTAGTLRLFGASDLESVRPRVGLLSHADHHYDDLSARENLLIAIRLGAHRDADPLPVLARVGLAERADDVVRGFSQGMRKRLSFARLLLKQAELVLLDEPYAGLDPAGALFVDGLVAELRAAGRTVLLSTHQVSRGAALCDDAVLLEAGRVRWAGKAADAGAHAGQLPPPADD